MKISAIITSWNGKKLLRKNLLIVIKNSPEVSEFIVADDASTDSSIAYLKKIKKRYPQLRILTTPHNLGFSANSNRAVRLAKGDLVVLLNNDISPHPGFLKASLKHFSDSKVLGVGFCELGNENWAKIFWSGGYIQHESGSPVDKPHPTAWVSGGGCIVRRQCFLKLGGFDPAFEPFYYEDADLGLRTWEQGYKLIWEPKSIIEHRHESTMSRFPKRHLDYVKERNRLLLTWRHITDKKLIWQNKLAMVGRVISGPNYIKIIRAAKRQMAKYPINTHHHRIDVQGLIKMFS
ncbi:MAG: glycosyltransferase family 2 protein [Candidatus Shapirobacteria bacterium]|jgi:GT2 family glycosyltransferase